MKTEHNKKVAYISAGTPISADLLRIFPAQSALTILDCGACDGLDSIIYSNLFPCATVYAIEARDDNYIELVDNFIEFNKFDSIIPGHFCLSDKAEETKFFRSSGDSGNVHGWDTGNKSSSLLPPTGHKLYSPWCKFTEEKTKTIRFDSLGITRVDFIHLDVQGAELLVLNGMGKVLDSVQAIWLEIASEELYSKQPLRKDIEGFLLARKFRKIKDTTRKFGDQLWVK